MSEAKKGTVLIVDTDPANLDTLSEHLGGAGFQVVVAQDDAGVLECVDRSRPDIILLDVILPDMDGFEILRRLEEKEQTSEIPIIFLTDKDDATTILKTLDTDSVDVITKPFSPHEVIARVNRHLAFHKLQKQVKAPHAEMSENQALSEPVQNDEIFKILVEQAHDVAYSVGIDGMISYMSPQIVQYGYTLEDVIGKQVLQFIAPEGREESWRTFQTLVKTGASTPVQLQWLGKDGTINWVEVSAKTVYDDSGQPVQSVGIMRNITERKQMQELLSESEKRFRLLVEQSQDVVYSVAPDGILNYLSPTIAHYGYSLEEVISKHFIEFVAPEQRQQVIESFETGTRAGTSYPTIFQWLKKDESRVWVEVVGNTVFDEA